MVSTKKHQICSANGCYSGGFCQLEAHVPKLFSLGGITANDAILLFLMQTAGLQKSRFRANVTLAGQQIDVKMWI